MWAPVHFADRTTFWHVNEDRHGHAWNTRAVIGADGAGVEQLAHGARRDHAGLEPGTRWVSRATLR